MPPDTQLVRSLRSGQITLPADFRRALRLDEAMFLQVTLEGNELRIRPYQPDKLETGSEWLRDLYGLFEPIRRQAVVPEAKLNAVIDLALSTLRERTNVQSSA